MAPLLFEKPKEDLCIFGELSKSRLISMTCPTEMVHSTHASMAAHATARRAVLLLAARWHPVRLAQRGDARARTL